MIAVHVAEWVLRRLVAVDALGGDASTETLLPDHRLTCGACG